MRAWTCHGRNQREMVERLTQAGIVHSQPVKDVLLRVDRSFYAPSDPYQDAPQPLSRGQTISAPHMHAYALEAMLPYLQRSKPQQRTSAATSSTTSSSQPQEQQQQEQPLKLLDIGCGSGYLTVCMGRWVDSSDSFDGDAILHRSGRVFGMDIFPELVQQAARNMQAAGDDDLLMNGIVQLKAGNGWQGWPEEAPFDAIHVGAAAARIPEQLASQLRVGGVLIVPVGPVGGAQQLLRVVRLHDSGRFDAKDYEVSSLLGVRYVPLIEEPRHN